MKSIQITTILPCSVNCYPYCPQGALHKAYTGKPILSVNLSSAS